jgi:vacuolar-type H+-ATPase subunit F/Vma7
MKILASVLFILTALRGIAQENVITEFFREYEGREDFTTIYITSKMFEMIAQIPEQEDEEDLLNVIRKLTGVRVLSADNYEDASDLYKKAYKLLPGHGFEELMIVRESDKETKFLVRQNGEIISELIMLSGGRESFSIISITGDLRLKDISRLSKTLDIQGFDHLDKVYDKP